MNDDKMKITTVRLESKQLDWIRQNHPQNLSRILREHLDDLMHRSHPVHFHNSWRENSQKCYPFISDGYCALCWPAGIPSKEKWNQYIREGQRISHGQIVSNMTWDEWYQLQHHNRQTNLVDWNFANTDQITQEESSQTVTDQVGIISRLLRFFFH